MQAMRQAGWLLEQETATILDRAGFEVTQSWPFPDADLPSNSREMDVIGMKRVHLNAKLNFSVWANVVVECKESSLPYALLGRTISPDRFAYARQEVQMIVDKIEYSEQPSPQGLVKKYVGGPQYNDLHHLTANPWAHDFEATLLVRLDKSGSKWSASNDGLMQDAMVPMAKAILHMRSGQDKANRARSDHLGSADGTRFHARVVLYFPLVVTSAPLYRIDASQEPPQIALAPFVPLRRRFDSTSLKGEFRTTVINAGALQDYVEHQVLGFANAVGKAALERPERFITSKDHGWPGDQA